MKTEPQFDKCPKGHILPNGDCTPLFCGNEAGKAGLRALKKSKVQLPRPKNQLPAEFAEQKELPPSVQTDAALTREHTVVSSAAARHKVRREFMKVPEGLQGADADKYVEEKLVELGPLAIAEIEYILRYGGDEQRYKAAKDVLAASGHGPKEAAAAVGALIVLTGDATVAPWKKGKVQVIDAKPLEPPK